MSERNQLREAPDLIDLVQELRRTVGLFDGAMPISPKQAWEEAIAEVERLRMVGHGGGAGQPDTWGNHR